MNENVCSSARPTPGRQDPRHPRAFGSIADARSFRAGSPDTVASGTRRRALTIPLLPPNTTLTGSELVESNANGKEQFNGGDV